MQKRIKQRYNYLRKLFRTKEFTLDSAAEALLKEFKDPKDSVITILSDLKKESCVEVKLDPEDSRKRIYRLVDPHLERFRKEVLDRKDLEALLKEAADLIRTKVDYTFILLLLFYKKVSDKWQKEYEAAYKESVDIYKLSIEDAKANAANPTYHDFIIPEEYLWENIRNDSDKLAENFSAAMKKMAEQNPDYKDVFENFDFVQFVNNRENQEILFDLVELFSVNSLEKASPDVLGDAYEWLIRLFAPQKAKEGEVYTPREVINLLVQLLDPKPGERIYDPALGSAGMLIGAHTYVNNKYGKEGADRLFMFGQEVNYKTRSIAKMNLYLHGIKNAIPEYGDTLLYPKFKEGGELMQFDIALANPPWNLDGYGEEKITQGDLWKKQYNDWGFAPDQSADWVWLEHMHYVTTEKVNGRVGVIMDNGLLFRGSKEKTIRQKMIEADLIESVILLPEKLFYNTGAPGCIMILNKNKRKSLKNKIIFINASQEFIQHPEVRRLNSISEENIKKIVEAFRDELHHDGFARTVEIEEVKDNDYNLNVSLYVFPEDEIEKIDIKREWVELNNIEKELSGYNEKIEIFLMELNL
ncbi:MAG: type I restriction-modification system subunit M [Bacteroidetes bacterium]|nr:type I restriction-modification system subunit M [Bacteroidota bacterium]